MGWYVGSISGSDCILEIRIKSALFFPYFVWDIGEIRRYDVFSGQFHQSI